MTTKLEELEIKMAFLEQSLNELSEEYVAQQGEISRLRKHVEQLAVALEHRQASDTVVAENGNEKPPHY